MSSTRLSSLSLAIAAFLACGAAPAPEVPHDPWATEFDAEPSQLASTGRNPYFILEPGYRLVLEKGSSRMVVTVLDETKTVLGVETRAVEERETWKGQPTELSRNYLAIHKRAHDLLQFAEEVSNYKNGKVVSRAGSWMAGVGDAKVGMVLPGRPSVGYRFYEEQAPGITMDRAEIMSVSFTQKTPAGTFESCLRTEVTSPMSPGEREYRCYAPGIGLVQFESMLLVEHGFRSGHQPSR